MSHDIRTKSVQIHSVVHPTGPQVKGRANGVTTPKAAPSPDWQARWANLIGPHGVRSTRSVTPADLAAATSLRRAVDTYNQAYQRAAREPQNVARQTELQEAGGELVAQFATAMPKHYEQLVKAFERSRLQGQRLQDGIAMVAAVMIDRPANKIA